MKITYRKLMHIACGQSLALERLEAYLKIFDMYITKYANTEKLNEENIRGFLKSFKKETKIAIKENNRIIDVAEDFVPTNNIISIDEVLQRRTSVRLNHNRVVTLRDLIRQLEFYEMLDKKASLKNAHERAIRRVQNYSRLSPEDIINLAHDEYIENGVQRLKANLEEILNRQDKIELNELTLLGMDRVSAYISLLFLTVDSDYDLVQEEFYSDLYVVKCPKTKTNHNEEEIEDNIFDAVENAKKVVREEENGTVEI